MPDRQVRYRRILLKLSGEALVGAEGFGIDPAVLKRVASDLLEVHSMGVQTSVVIGGGNIFRGLHASEYGLTRVPADQMGMLATVINAIALGEVVNSLGGEARVMSAIDMNKISEPYVRGKALNHLKERRIVIFGAGTGNPYFSTDTAAALRAMEMGAEVLLKATKVDGVYPDDPVEDPSAKPFLKLTYQEMLKRNLRVMDMTAVTLAMGQNLPIIVFNLRKEGSIQNVVLGERVGTLISGE
ncbi:MAG: UMP kinase [Deltaproteobacteria bacterium HGW-Deltaproteobacteria-21]|jgi:uridylate kinase|nr:MAG: UMP kinase [Deltaproteobacteria bacterium HGW-Deltaproteobacteria-21]PKN62973.1 MAG: UMP kinase [Deltaproteobacteria bacterium HGW-Deltaproteobacteria-15]